MLHQTKFSAESLVETCNCTTHLLTTQGHFYDGLYDDVKNDDVFSTTSINDDGDFRRQTIRRRVLFDDVDNTTTDFSTTLIIRRPTFRRRGIFDDRFFDDVPLTTTLLHLFLTNFTGSISHKTFYDNIFFLAETPVDQNGASYPQWRYSLTYHTGASYHNNNRPNLT